MIGIHKWLQRRPVNPPPGEPSFPATLPGTVADPTFSGEIPESTTTDDLPSNTESSNGIKALNNSQTSQRWTHISSAIPLAATLPPGLPSTGSGRSRLSPASSTPATASPKAVSPPQLPDTHVKSAAPATMSFPTSLDSVAADSSPCHRDVPSPAANPTAPSFAAETTALHRTSFFAPGPQ
ncbi:hypothetical protein MLD38_003003 [Melastoma candidum]|uniref:Uncharacterized protein n=1 Tax=Melastoma candidum TaxID=119954 RepID=A0ACB9S4Z6_9MYRT|nr:hypothetical protein MLD38_003003 [Melastoma candidum]